MRFLFVVSISKVYTKHLGPSRMEKRVLYVGRFLRSDYILVIEGFLTQYTRTLNNVLLSSREVLTVYYRVITDYEDVGLSTSRFRPRLGDVKRCDVWRRFERRARKRCH